MRSEVVRTRIERGRAQHQRWTQQAIADALDLPQTAISKRLAGSVEWRLSELEKLANHLGVPLAELLDDSESDLPSQREAESAGAPS